MHNTPKWNIPVIDGTDPINQLDDVDALKSALLDNLLTPYDVGAFVSRPVSTPSTPGIRGRRYYAYNLGIEFVDLGTGWAPSGIPLGGGVDWFGASDPCAELLICDGRAISRSTYSGLFSIVGTTFGAGDGSTTFNIPDTRDRTLVGVSGTIARGATGGAKTHTLTTPEMPSHTHAPPLQNFALTAGSNATPNTGGASQTTSSATGSTASAGGGGAHNNMQPYLGAHKVIRVL
jgi:microcystin-dependent protein